MNGSGRVGYRFHPSDEEIIDYFLRRKINGSLPSDDDICVIDICKFEPWDLPKHAAQGPKEDEWYFFHRREMKNKNSSKLRYNRSTKTGHWKPTGKERPIKAKRSRTEIGVKKTLVFYKYAESKKKLRTNWVIHEYEPKAFPSHQADLVLCKLKEKADNKAETSTCREAEFTPRGPSDFDVLPAEISSSEVLLQSTFPNNDQPYTLQPQNQIDEERFSIDDLLDDIFQSGSNQFETNDQQLDPNEMDMSLFDRFSSDPIGSSLQTGHAHSGSGQSHSGIDLLEIADMDSDHFYGLPSQFGDQNLSSGYSGLTETLPAPICEAQSMHRSSSRNEPSGVTKNLERHGKASKGSPILVEAHTTSGNGNLSVGISKGRFQVNLSRPSELKAREARNRRNLPCESQAKPITLEALMSTSDKACFSSDPIGYSLQRGHAQSSSGQSHSGMAIEARKHRINLPCDPPEEKINLKTENLLTPPLDPELWVYHQSLSHTTSGNKNMAAEKSQIQVKFSELKAREARKRGTGLNLPCDPPEEKITLKTEKEAKRILMPTSGSDKTCSSINTETSMLYQRSAPLSVYIINVSIGLVLFVAPTRDLLIYH